MTKRGSGNRLGCIVAVPVSICIWQQMWFLGNGRHAQGYHVKSRKRDERRHDFNKKVSRMCARASTCWKEIFLFRGAGQFHETPPPIWMQVWASVDVAWRAKMFRQVLLRFSARSQIKRKQMVFIKIIKDFYLQTKRCLLSPVVPTYINVLLYIIYWWFATTLSK
jgi:hypothetical protein